MKKRELKKELRKLQRMSRINKEEYVKKERNAENGKKSER